MLNARLEKMADEVLSDRFLQSKGLGNEMPYYIFDYDPVQEREFRKGLRTKLDYLRRHDLHVLHLDLFDVMLDILTGKKLMDRIFPLEDKKGSAYIWESLKKSVSAETVVNKIAEAYRDARPRVLFLSGMGKVWPVVRGHTILNRLQELIDEVPVVLFFPGRYSGQELSLFGRIHDDNYYRAFRLIPREDD